GNCAAFCPYENAAPYKDKITLFRSEEDFEESENSGFLRTADGYKIRRENKTVASPGETISKEMREMIDSTPERCFY
ncbi:MAG: hypothetical protein FWE68_03370, partial [Defluviitaleaceae bacterium]|nr:hypothetical protein [Defluviitaleaceae bacterium]